MIPVPNPIPEPVEFNSKCRAKGTAPLPSIQLAVTEAIPPAYLQRARWTLGNFPLRDDERIIRVRRERYRMYLEGELTIDGLRK